ncbi:MAG: hypothetical protein ISS15_06730 [Alphaproteobacteria bacterium]|nr:hypothetical protein [Alphaproteobacteria bacterium]
MDSTVRSQLFRERANELLAAALVTATDDARATFVRMALAYDDLANISAATPQD